jgi:hypothetical protein
MNSLMQVLLDGPEITTGAWVSILVNGSCLYFPINNLWKTHTKPFLIYFSSFITVCIYLVSFLWYSLRLLCKLLSR